MSQVLQTVGISFNFLIAAFAGAFLGKLLPVAKDQAVKTSASVGNLIVHAVNTQVDPSLRAFVLTELASIANQVETQSQTALQTSLSVLEKALPSIPTATLSQVSQIVAEFVLTFETGLSGAFSGALATASSGVAVATSTAVPVTSITSTQTTTTTQAS